MSVLLNEIYNEDCIKLMERMESNSVDLIVTDPPFGIDFKANLRIYKRSIGNVLKGYAETKKSNYRNFSVEWIGRAKRVLKEDGSMYIISGTTNLSDILFAIEKNGLKIINHIIWHYNFGVFTKKKYVTSHYHVLYVAKNPAKVSLNLLSRFTEDQKKECYADRQDVWCIKREFWKNCQKTPTKLPKELVKKIIEYSSLNDQVVFDPFAGSGQVPFVAQELGRNFIACEIMPDIYQFAKERISKKQYLIDLVG